MSVTSVLVQLPSFSYSFSVSIPSASTILDFKNEITKVCAGAPSPNGQRVIYRGRVLGDSEIVGDVWKVSDEPHTCHLAVHPSAWTATPPDTPSSSILMPQNQQAYLPPPSPRPAMTTPLGLHVLALPHTTYPYILYLHTNALRILARQPRLPWTEQMGDMENARLFAKRGIEATGRGWPPYLNQDFPSSAVEPGQDEGVKYASTYIDNLPYLSLLTPDATPTALQTQAIRVLSYTFPLLCVYAPPQHNTQVQVHPFGPRALFPVAAAFPQIPIRPLIIPLLLLTFRTILLIYFFQPARKPLFGFMILVWVTWEVFNAVRIVIGGGNRNGEQNNRVQGQDNPNNGALGGGAAAGARPLNNNNVILRPAMNSHDAILMRMARINLAAEAPFVESASAVSINTPPPSLPHKIKSFFALLLLTLHPAIWDRRRTALREREGRVREEARTREARALQRERERAEREENLRRGIDVPPATNAPEPSPFTPRPFWVTEYIHRVRSGDWVDD